MSTTQFTDLATHLTALRAFLEAAGLPPPSREVRIIEVGNDARLDAQGRIRVTRASLCPPVAFEARFDELMEQSFPWLNLSCYGLVEDFLIVAVETPRQPVGQADHTSVNYSGPGRQTLDRGWDACDLIVLE